MHYILPVFHPMTAGERAGRGQLQTLILYLCEPSCRAFRHSGFGNRPDFVLSGYQVAHDEKTGILVHFAVPGLKLGPK